MSGQTRSRCSARRSNLRLPTGVIGVALSWHAFSSGTARGRCCCTGTTCKCDYMTTAVDDLVSLFATKLQMDGTRVSPVAQGSRELRVEYRGDNLTLVLPEGVLSALLAQGDELARYLWDPSVSAQEAAAQLMTVHLQESLESSGHETSPERGLTAAAASSGDERQDKNTVRTLRGSSGRLVFRRSWGALSQGRSLRRGRRRVQRSLSSRRTITADDHWYQQRQRGLSPLWRCVQPRACCRNRCRCQS